MSTKRRAAAGVAVLIAGVAAGAGHALYTGLGALDRVGAAGDEITVYQSRFDAIRAALPERGVVGYVSNAPRGSINEMSRWYVAQYALSPRVLVPGKLDAPHVVADFGTPAGARDAARAAGLVVVAEADNGVAVLAPADASATTLPKKTATAPGWGRAMIVVWELAVFVVPAVVGLAIVDALLRVRGRWLNVLKASLALPVGIGACSLAMFAWLVIVGRPGGYPTVEVTMAALLAAWRGRVAWRERRGTSATASDQPLLASPGRGAGHEITLVVTLAFACAAATYVVKSAERPHGAWDAWAIWNLRARFLFRGGDHWLDAFHPDVAWSHTDYPLLLGAFVARSWWMLGGETTRVPVLLHAGMTAGLVGALMAAVALAGGARAGLLAGAALIATPGFVANGASQQADVPLAMFMVGVVAVWVVRDALPADAATTTTTTTSISRVAPRLAVLAGGLAGLAAWTKNEGLLFAVVAIAARTLFVARARGLRPAAAEIGCFALGAAPAAVAIAYLKLRLAPPNDLVHAGRLSGALPLLSDPSRYAALPPLLAIRLAPFAVPLAVLVVATVLLGWNRRPRASAAIRAGAAVFAAMAVAYVLVYVTTPHDLRVHVLTSADRLGYQLWPLVLLLVFAHLRTDPAPAAPRPAPGAIVR
jgi:hypothetical protein